MLVPHVSSNVPSTISYGPIFSELLRIARCTLRTNNFISGASDLFSRMIAQAVDTTNNFHCYPTVFQKLGKTHKEINISIMKNTL